MRPLLGAVIVLMSLLPAAAMAQDYNVIKSDSSESFTLPYTATNRHEDDPLVYTFDEPKGETWIMTIRNNLDYVQSNDSQTIIRFQEAAPSEKYIELLINGGESKRYWVAINTLEAGYARMYDSENGWTTEFPISVTSAQNGGVTVTNGNRIVLDRLDTDGFVLSSIAVYGNDGNKTTANAYAGDISFEILFGSFAQSSLYYVPLGITLGVGALIGGLLYFKKRK
jgi:hypothetical protein